MCRFVFYQGRPIRLGSLITDPKHALIYQSFKSKERDEPLNGDGFGLAWYNPSMSDQPGLFKSISPAWSNNNLQELSRIIESPCIMAHVRAATQGLNVTETNCHPFKWKNMAFMHNGDVAGFSKIKRALINTLGDEAYNQIKGTTDSEHFFAVLIDEVLKEKEENVSQKLPFIMERTVRRVLNVCKAHSVSTHSYLNMVLSDGHSAIVARITTDKPERADSLYINLGRKYVCEEGYCYMKDPGEYEKAVIVSSEPLSQDPGWEPVPVNTLLLIKEAKVVERIEFVL